MREEVEKEYCDAHKAYCIRLQHLEKGQDAMEGKITKMWYLMLTTLASVIVTGIGVFLLLLIRVP